MVGTTLNQELKNYIQSMHNEGVLDEHFDHLKGFQSEENPLFLVDLIGIFNRDAENYIAQITENLIGPAVDLARASYIAHQLKGCSGGIGGGRMAFVCSELRQACEHGDWARSLQLFDRVKQEYNTLYTCLNNVEQMERRILENEMRRRRG